jgi:DNA-binding beta-propeller fold protein YncE
VLDADDGRALGRLPLGGEAGNVAYDPMNRRVLVDVQTHSELAVIDPAPPGVGVVERTVPLSGCRNNHGLQVDATARLAYVSCVGNSSLLVLDLASLAVLARFGIGADADVLALDDVGRRLYVAAESGVVAMFAIDGRALRKLGEQRLAAKAHTVAVDPVTHRVFFPLENVRGRPVLRVLAPA